MISSYYGKTYSTEELRRKSFITREGVSLGGLAEAAEDIGFHSLPVTTDFLSLKKEIPLPCIAHWRQGHFVVIYEISERTVIIGDPGHGILKYQVKDFIDGWMGTSNSLSTDRGYLLLLEPTPRFYNLHPQENRKIGLKYLFVYFKPFKKLIFQLFLGLFVGSLIQLIFPFLTQAIVDYGIRFENLNFIYLILIAQLVLFMSQTSVNMVRSWILLHITTRVNISLISDFLTKMMRLPIAFFDSKKTGDIIQRIYDHNRIQNFLSTSSLNTLFSVFNVIIFGAILAYYSFTIFIIFLIGSLMYISWTLLFLKKRAELDYKRFDQTAEHQSSLHQLISGMQEIKLNGSEKRRRWEWEEIQAKLFKISIKGLTLSQTQNNGGRFIDELKNIVITFIAAKAVIDGHLTLGMMLSVQYIIGQLNSPIRNFVGFIQSGQDAKISLERLSEIHSIEDEDKMEKDSNSFGFYNEEIKLQNVVFKYGGRSSPIVLHNLSLLIPKGKVTAIVGTSGSGIPSHPGDA
ncbi:ABC transporter transmembrane domain-containing protein [Muricauda sp. SCSIO 64092]|nr:ABC transporter transmembrane domain-containing protein [Muricauda sp. SCSIO 64092]